MDTLRPYLLALLLVAIGTTAQAEKLLKKQVDISGISAVVLEGPGKLNLRQGNKESLEIIASQKALDAVKVKIHNEELSLGLNQGSKWNFFGFEKNIQYNLTLKELDSLEITGSANVEAKTNLESADLDIERSGSGSISLLDLDADKLEIDISGAGKFSAKKINAKKIKFDNSGAGRVKVQKLASKGKVSFDLSGAPHVEVKELYAETLKLDISGAGKFASEKGEINYQNIDISGSGYYTAPTIKSKQANLDLSGATHVKIYVTDSLKVDASGASNVGYYGEPQTHLETSGASNIKSLGPKP